MKTTALMLGLLFLASCGVKVEEKKSKASGPVVNQYFVQGNPMSLVEGTALNKESFITTENFLEFDNAYLSSVKFFLNKAQKVDKKSAEDGAPEGAPRMMNELLMRGAFTWSKDKNLYVLGNKELKFKFKENKNKQLDLKIIQLEASRLETEIIHYSVTPDKRYFSILVSINEGEFNYLLSATFYLFDKLSDQMKKVEAEVSSRALKEEFNYLGGPGKAIPWPASVVDNKRTIHIDVCPSMEKSLSFNKIKYSLLRWSGDSLTININKKEKCLPFSDVNEHSVHLIRSYITTNPNTRFTNPGVTLVETVNSTYIMDADIFIYDKEVRKTLGPYMWGSDEFLKNTLMHEMGHFLGLGHKFKDKESIMSYEDVPDVGEVDRAALKNLYP